MARPRTKQQYSPVALLRAELDLRGLRGLAVAALNVASHRGRRDLQADYARLADALRFGGPTKPYQTFQDGSGI